MFHMGWFIGRGYSVHAWNRPWSGTIGTDYMQPDPRFGKYSVKLPDGVTTVCNPVRAKRRCGGLAVK